MPEKAKLIYIMKMDSALLPLFFFLLSASSAKADLDLFAPPEVICEKIILSNNAENLRSEHSNYDEVLTNLTQATTASNTNISSTHPFGQFLHILPEQFVGGLDGLLLHAPHFQKLGVKTLLLGASNPQTTEYNLYRDENGNLKVWWNDGRYWPSDHRYPSESVGGVEAEARLIKALHAQGTQVIADAVLNHYGYLKPDQSVYFEGKMIKPSRLPKEIFREPLGVEQEHWDRLEATNEKDNVNYHNPKEVLHLQQEIFSRRNLQGLPAFDHRNPRVQEHLINCYKDYIDRGYDGFRIDAALYIDFDFLARFIDELSEYAMKTQGKKINFIVELLARTPFPFKILIDDLLKRIKHQDRVHFLDFPQMYEIQDNFIKKPNASFNWYPDGYLDYIKLLQIDRHRLVSTIENHDFGKIIRNPQLQQAVYALVEFTSYQPGLLFHGTETPGRSFRQRGLLGTVSEESELMKMTSAIEKLLSDYFRSSSEELIIDKLFDEETAKDVGLFAIESTDKTKRAYLLVTKPDPVITENDGSERIDPKARQLTLPITIRSDQRVEIKYQSGEGAMRVNDENLVLNLNGFSIVLFEVSEK